MTAFLIDTANALFKVLVATMAATIAILALMMMCRILHDAGVILFPEKKDPK